MNIEAADLYPGEEVIVSKPANSVISIQDYGLGRLSMKSHGVTVPCDQLMSLIGFKGQEAIGGKLHLTSYRLIFKSHPINRVKGQFSILLPTVEDLQDKSKFIAKKMEVRTHTQSFLFVIWGVEEFIGQIRSAAGRITPDSMRRIQKLIAADPHKIGGGLQVFKAIDRAFAETPEIADKLLELVTDPLSVTNIINILELWKKLSSEDAKEH
jgi:hypothetical protein